MQIIADLACLPFGRLFHIVTTTTVASFQKYGAQMS